MILIMRYISFKHIFLYPYEYSQRFDLLLANSDELVFNF